MRFRTRAFLICFVPLATLLAASSWIVQRVVQSTVRDGIRSSLRENQLAVNRVQRQSDLQNSRFLRVVGDNAALKAGIELLSTETDSSAARRTVEDQLLELGEHMGFDLLAVTAGDGSLQAGVVRKSAAQGHGAGPLVPLEKAASQGLRQGVFFLDGQPVQVAAMPLEVNRNSLGRILLGKRLELSAFATSTVLLHNGEVVMSSIPGTALPEVQAALSLCRDGRECQFQLHGHAWMTTSAPLLTGRTEYALRSVEDVDAALAPMRSGLRRIFLLVACCSLLIVLLCSLASSQSVVRPIAVLVTHMRQDAQTGVLTEFERNQLTTLEMRELAESYNRAAVSVRRGRENLQGAYVEFVGALASALDARDPYTAGHSRRVSEIACAIGSELGLSLFEVEQIRTGALLHDIGKIGVPDHVLQKTGRLTPEEFHAVKQHPVIGRRILEGVRGFVPFLSAVELHHENWDGTGYPSGQAGEQVPLDARIIHVADAYDAMTTDRSYRKGMTHATAIRILEENAGTQFDPNLVEIFFSIAHRFHVRHLELLDFVNTPHSEAAEVA